jgi:hypothetical protein
MTWRASIIGQAPWRWVPRAFSLFVAGAAWSTAVSGAETGAAFKQTVLAAVPTNASIAGLVVSPDNAHVAFVVEKDGAKRIQHDGSVSSAYQEVRELVFSPDGSRLAASVKQGNSWRVVLDGKELKTHADIGPECLAFSANSRHFAYVAREEGKWTVMVDGKPGNPYDRIAKGSLWFSPDGSRLAFPAIRNKECFLVVDGQEGIRCDGISKFAFSPDNRRVAYVAPKGEEWLVVIDGKATAFHQVLEEGVIFSPDSLRTIHGAAAEPGKFRAYVDNRPGAEFEMFVPGGLLFSSDSRHVFVAGKRGDVWTLERDGVELLKCRAIMSQGVVVSPVGDRWACGLLQANGWSVVLDGKAGPACEGIGAQTLTFSPDGKRFGYCAGRGGKFYAVVDEKEHGPYDGLGNQGLVFSPDSRHFAFVARDSEGWKAVVDGGSGKAWEGIVARPFAFVGKTAAAGFIGVRRARFAAVAGDVESGPFGYFLVNPAWKGSTIESWIAQREGQGTGQEFVRLEYLPALATK